MARVDQAEALRGNRADSLARRPPTMVSPNDSQSRQFEGRKKLAGACEIAIGRITPDPDQPRKTFPKDSIVQLADSLKARGQLVPTLVRWSESEDSYILVDGERRYRAALKAGLDTMTCVVTSDASPEDLLEVQLVTNALRDDVPPVEQGRAYQALIEAKGYSRRELADRLNVSHPTIIRALDLLNLPASVQAMVDDGELSPSTAHGIMSNVEDPAIQEQVAGVGRTACGLARGDGLALVAPAPPSGVPGSADETGPGGGA
jgi:ParB family chromosome partitioning protein